MLILDIVYYIFMKSNWLYIVPKELQRRKRRLHFTAGTVLTARQILIRWDLSFDLRDHFRDHRYRRLSIPYDVVLY